MNKKILFAALVAILAAPLILTSKRQVTEEVSVGRFNGKVYYGTIFAHAVLEWVDAASFQSISGSYFKDKNHVYIVRLAYAEAFNEKFEWKISVDIDPNTVEYVWGDILKDKGHVYGLSYYGGYTSSNYVIDQADPATFQVVDRNFCKDANHVYINLFDSKAGIIRYEIVKWADPKTFQVLNYQYAKDDSTVYSYGNNFINPTSLDPKTMR